MEPTTRTRRRYRPAEREEILGRFERSGQTLKSFCAVEGLSVATLANWRRRSRDRSPGGYACFTLPGVAEIALRFPCGVELRLPSPDAASLRTLIEHLHGLGCR